MLTIIIILFLSYILEAGGIMLLLCLILIITAVAAASFSSLIVFPSAIIHLVSVIVLSILIIICLGFISSLFRTYGLKGVLVWIEPAFSTEQRKKKRVRLSEIKVTLEDTKAKEMEKQRRLEEIKITRSIHNRVAKKIKKMEKQLRKHDFVDFEYSDCFMEIRLPGIVKDQQLVYRINTYVDYISRTEYTPAFQFRRISFTPAERKLLEKFQFYDADQSFQDPDKMIKRINKNLREDIEKYISSKKAKKKKGAGDK